MHPFPIRRVLFAAILAGFSAPAAAGPKSDNSRYSVIASYYGGGGRERLNKHTASGAVFRPNGLTAAHRTLPIRTKLLVSRAGRSVVVTINDRGPAAWTGRSLDLSRGAAARLAMLGVGVAPVNVQVLE
jgi:rare lipoprotein A